MSALSSEFDDLLDKARAGDDDAMSQLVGQYHNDIRIIARAHLGPALRPYMDSLDLVQSVHHSLIVGLRAQRFEFASADKLVALASVVLRRKVARHWRTLRRQQRESGIRPPDSNLPDYVVSLDGRERDPADIASFRDQIAFVLNRLNGDDRDLVTLRLEGYSTADAARRLNLDADVARVRLSRLRRQLKDTSYLSALV